MPEINALSLYGFEGKKIDDASILGHDTVQGDGYLETQSIPVAVTGEDSAKALRLRTLLEEYVPPHARTEILFLPPYSERKPQGRLENAMKVWTFALHPDVKKEMVDLLTWREEAVTGKPRLDKKA